MNFAIFLHLVLLHSVAVQSSVFTPVTDYAFVAETISGAGGVAQVSFALNSSYRTIDDKSRTVAGFVTWTSGSIPWTTLVSDKTTVTQNSMALAFVGTSTATSIETTETAKAVRSPKNNMSLESVGTSSRAINATSYIQQHHPLHVYCHC